MKACDRDLKNEISKGMRKGIAFFNFLFEKKQKALLQRWDLQRKVNVLLLLKLKPKKSRTVKFCLVMK